MFRAYLHCDRIENDAETALQIADAQTISTLLQSSGGNNEVDFSAIGTVCERILSFGISFMFSLLEDPNVWRSTMLPFDADIEGEDDGEERKGEQGDDLAAERLCETVLFTQANTLKIYSSLTRKYLVYTTEEIEQWTQDSLKFFLDAKNESNECKGNFLREKA